MASSRANILAIVEGATHGVAPSLLLIGASYALRIFFESFSIAAQTSSLFPLRSALLELGPYFTLLLTITGLVLWRATRRPPATLVRVAALGSLVFLLVPLIDLLVYHGQAPIIQFVDRGSLLDLLAWAARFGTGSSGITLGLQVEVAATLLGVGAYTYLVTGRVLRSLVAALGVYAAIVAAATLPALLALAHLDTSLVGTGELSGVFLAVGGGVVLLAVRGRLSWGRVAAYALPGVAVAVLATNTVPTSLHPIILLQLAVLALLLAAAATSWRQLPAAARTAVAATSLGLAYLFSPWATLLTGLLLAARATTSGSPRARLFGVAVGAAAPLVVLVGPTSYPAQLATWAAVAGTATVAISVAEALARVLEVRSQGPVAQW